MTVRRALSCLALVLVAVACARSQDSHDHGGQTHDRSPTGVLHTIYRIDATIVPDSALVRGMVDISFTNRTGDTLSEILFRLGTEAGARCVLDSILMFGAPVPADGKRREGEVLHIDVPMGLPPGERISFLTTYTCYLEERGSGPLPADGSLLEFWYPEICAYTDVSRPCPQPGLFSSMSHPLIRYQAVLRIDSAWTLVFPGRLINEKEHFGLIREPDSGEVFIDITRRHSRKPLGEPYRPVFEAGIKTYTVSASGHGLPLVPLGDPAFDRAQAAGVVITCVYDRSAAELWSGTAAAVVAYWLPRLERESGRFPFERVTVARIDDDRCFYQAGSLVGVAERWDSPEALQVAVGIALAACWPLPDRAAGQDSADVGAKPAGYRELLQMARGILSSDNGSEYETWLDSLGRCGDTTSRDD